MRALQCFLMSGLHLARARPVDQQPSSIGGRPAAHLSHRPICIHHRGVCSCCNRAQLDRSAPSCVGMVGTLLEVASSVSLLVIRQGPFRFSLSAVRRASQGQGSGARMLSNAPGVSTSWSCTCQFMCACQPCPLAGLFHMPLERRIISAKGCNQSVQTRSYLAVSASGSFAGE